MTPQEKVLLLLEDMGRYMRQVDGHIAITDEALAQMGLVIEHNPLSMVTSFRPHASSLVLKGDFLITDDNPEPAGVTGSSRWG